MKDSKVECHKSKLLIISDLRGFENSSWIENYVKLLKPNFELTLYDACELAGINKTNLTESEIHSQFINGGISCASNRLLELESEEINILGFSIGGTIAWQAAIKGLKLNSLHAISSTRLRYETEKPNCVIYLIYGEKDPFVPENIWFEKIDLSPRIIKNELHTFYKKKTFVKSICEKI